MNLFRIMQSIRAMAQAGKIDFPGAVKYLTDLGVEMNGIVHQALRNVFKEGKARDPEFGNVVKDFPIDDRGIPFNPNTLKSTTEKRGIRGTSEADRDIAFIQEGIDDLNKVEREADLVSQKEGIENLFKKKSKTVKKLPKEPKYGKLDYDKIAKLEGIDVEEIRGKSFREIIEYLAMIQKKGGGRVGFEIGGLSSQAQSIYDSWIAAGHTEEDVLAYLTSQGLYGDQEAEGIETITNTAPAITQGGDNDRAIRMPITKKTAVQPTLQGDYDIYGNKIAESAKTGILQKAKRNVWDPIATVAGAALDIPLGLLTSGAKLIGGMLPYNERAVMENKMLESGFALDDIGRIVAAGDYNTPEGIMAGYNAAQMTADTFDKRMHAIRNRKIAQTDISRKRLKDIQKAKELWQAAQDAASKDKIASQGGQWHTTGGGQDTPGAGGQNVTSSSGDVYGGAAYGYNEAAEKSDYYKKGGLATMFTRRR